MRIDHVIYATADLDATAERLAEELGAPVHPGGRHEGMGTHNRILPLGGGYLEVLAVADPAEAAASPFGAAILRRLELEGDGLAGWAVAVDDVAPVAARLGTALGTISREGLTARLTGVAEALAEPCLPFFIARDEGIPDPGAGVGLGGITWIEVSGAPSRIAAWLGDADLPVRVVEGPPALVAAGVGTHTLR